MSDQTQTHPNKDVHKVKLSSNHWENELQKPSLKEPPLKSKWLWLKPLTVYHSLEFRGLDKRDYYEPPEYDAWDHQVWNTPPTSRFIKKCANYQMDLNKCHRYLKAEFPFVKTSFNKRHDYCWKIQDNLSNCKRVL